MASDAMNSERPGEKCAVGTVTASGSGSDDNAEYMQHLEVARQTAHAMLPAARAYGLNSNDLMVSRSFAIPPLNSVTPFSTLSNPILPLLGRNRWPVEAQDVFPMLEPALRLASLFLSEPSISSYWLTLIDGKRTRFSYAKLKTPRAYSWIQKEMTPSASNPNRVMEFLALMQNHIHYNFHDDAKGRPSFGWCDTNESEDGTHEHDININPIFRNFAKTNMGRTQDNPNAILRFNFLMAVTLTHEIAHAVSNILGDGREVYYLKNHWTEAGYAWEVDVLHGIVELISRPGHLTDGFSLMGGLMILDPTVEESPGSRDPTLNQTKYAVPMSYIWRIQQEQSWATLGTKKELCRIPRIGAIATK